MSDVAIKIEGLGKKFHMGRAWKSKGNSLRDSLGNSVTQSVNSLQARLRGQKRESAPSDEFWALKDITFDVKKGEVLGLAGKNGSGKSTLLKILARITRPTTGFAEIYGRLGALLDVGTGFHPDLTGRENVYLAGSILGMKRTELNKMFDSIVDFAGVERFIDTQIKYYSSGMYVRLAFSVSVHLNTDVLLVDEVLTVGDTEFQMKSVERMKQAAFDGKTVILVTHIMPLMQQICNRVVLLSHGEYIMSGPPAETIAHYMNLGEKAGV